MNKKLLFIAAIMGLLAVALGAFGSHGLKKVISPEMVNIFNLGVQYQFYHTFALLSVALTGYWIRSRLLNWAGYFFIAGILLFSGSLYIYALLGSKWMGPITPLGGICFMAGWILMAVAIWRNRNIDITVISKND